MKALSIALAGATLAAVVAAAPLARADEGYLRRPYDPYSRRDFYMGAEGVGSLMLNQTGPHQFFDHGGGFNLFLGGRVARHLAIEFGWQPTFHGQPGDGLGRPVDGLGLSAVTFDFKAFPIGGPIQPYFSIGPGAYFLTDSRLDFIAAGGGWQIGGGVDFWVLPVLSLGAKVQYRGVELVDYDPQHDATYLSLLTLAGNLTGHF